MFSFAAQWFCFLGLVLLSGISVVLSTGVTQCIDDVCQARAPADGSADGVSMLQNKPDVTIVRDSEGPEESKHHTSAIQRSSGSGHLQTRSRALQDGVWNAEKQRFEFEPNKDFLYTWEASGSERINVTASDATQASGPLSLLSVLQRSEAEAGTLASRVKNAHRAGHLQVHLIGVDPTLEPMMLWHEFLAGPLPPEFQRIAKAFRLPVARFAGMNISLLFNCYSCKWLAKRRAQFPPGYSEAYVSGAYHDVVSEIPDLVFMGNPGLAHYPQAWGKTLKELRLKGIPIIATGYGTNTYTGPYAAMDTIYKSDYILTANHAAGLNIHHCKNMPILELEGGTLCGDMAANSFVADKMGYRVQLAERNPFSYCDNPSICWCDSSTVISLLEPKPAVHQDVDPNALLYRDVALKSAGCFSVKDSVLSCMKNEIDWAIQPGDQLQTYVKQDFMDDLLKSAHKSCSAM